MAPNERLSIGSCAQEVLSGRIPAKETLELYLWVGVSTECLQKTTETVRKFPAEDDDAKFGSDIVSNTFHSNPFSLFKDECDIKIYEVQTKVSENSKSLQTTMKTVDEFTSKRSSERSKSLGS